MKRKAWYCAAAALCLVLFACQSESEMNDGTSMEVMFRVVNYTQYSLDEVTRSSADVLDHLVLGVFDAETDAPVGSLIVQDKGDTGYGTFTVSLSRGSYRLVFLGYNGTKACRMTASSTISFEDDAVPQTFLYSTLLTVGDEAVAAQDVVLKRAVGAFRLTLADAIPSNLATMRFRFAAGSTKLDGQTGYGKDNAGRTYDISIPSSYIGKTDTKMTVYLFLPASEASMDITVDALSSDGGTIHSRNFSAVPMKINQMLNYTGLFFADPSSDLSATVTVDDAWGSEQTVSF